MLLQFSPQPPIFPPFMHFSPLLHFECSGKSAGSGCSGGAGLPSSAKKRSGTTTKKALGFFFFFPSWANLRASPAASSAWSPRWCFWRRWKMRSPSFHVLLLSQRQQPPKCFGTCRQSPPILQHLPPPAPGAAFSPLSPFFPWQGQRRLGAAEAGGGFLLHRGAGEGRARSGDGGSRQPHVRILILSHHHPASPGQTGGSAAGTAGVGAGSGQQRAQPVCTQLLLAHPGRSRLPGELQPPSCPVCSSRGLRGGSGAAAEVVSEPGELSASAAPLQLPGSGMQHALLPADRARQECGRAGSCTSLLFGEPGDMGWWPRGRSLSHIPCHSGAQSCRG